MRILFVPQLSLEPQIAAHAPEMFCVLSDPAIYEFENEPPTSEQVLVERFSRLESRQSADGSEIWLNWVIRLPKGELAGYIQATVFASGTALLAYELASKHWRKGIVSTAVDLVLGELRSNYAVHLFAAILKTRNFRSLGLLRKLGFEPASPTKFEELGSESDELVMVKFADDGQSAG